MRPLPPRLQVEVSNACSLGCASCARHHWDEDANAIGQLDEATLVKLAPLLDHALELTIGGYGDPTEGRLLLPLLRDAKARGCSVRLITGGSKLSHALIGQLVDAGLDRLVLSMDGARDATLRALRGVPLRAYLKWIRAVVAARSWRPLIQLNVVLQWGNLDELVELVELCDREGVAGIHAFHLKAYGPAMLDRCLLTDPERAAPPLAAAAERAAQLGVFLHLPGEQEGCNQPAEHLFVRHDGRVRACCSGLFEPAEHGLAIGHLDDGLDALLASPALERFFTAQAAGAPDGAWPRPCQRCAFRKPQLATHHRPLAVLTGAA